LNKVAVEFLFGKKMHWFNNKRYRSNKENTMIRLEEEGDESSKPTPMDSKMDELILKNRRIFLSAPVSDQSANDVIRKLWYLELTDPGKPIVFIINSPGGAVDSGFAIWDQIRLITSPITTLVTGLAASMGSVLSLVADKGKRYATPNSRIMIHQPSIHGVIRGQATDLEIHAKEILKTRDALIHLYVEATGQKPQVIEKALDRDTWMSAHEAKEFGLIDKIVSSPKEFSF
jgi:ATP-dependent Clp protease, protease subunit